MWIKQLPVDYKSLKSLFDNNVFLWHSEKVFVMDNHMAALWCWMQTCEPNKGYNFMHIDRHYDLLDCFEDKDLVPILETPGISFEDFTGLMKRDGRFKVFRWDNYIMAGFFMHPEWFDANVFLTHGEGDKEPKWGHEAMNIREENPLFMEDHIQQFIGDPNKYLDGLNEGNYNFPWIVNLDLDVFYTKDSHIQLFSDDYIRRVAELFQKNMERIAALTIAISPDCLGGENQYEKWENGLRLLRIMSEELMCLKEFEEDCH